MYEFPENYCCPFVHARDIFVCSIHNGNEVIDARSHPVINSTTQEQITWNPTLLNQFVESLNNLILIEDAVISIDHFIMTPWLDNAFRVILPF